MKVQIAAQDLISGFPHIPSIPSFASMFEFLYNVAVGPDLSRIARYMSDCFPMDPDDEDYLSFLENHIRAHPNSSNALAPSLSTNEILNNPSCTERGLLLAHHYALLDEIALDLDRRQDDWALENTKHAGFLFWSNEDKRCCISFFTEMQPGEPIRSWTNSHIAGKMSDRLLLQSGRRGECLEKTVEYFLMDVALKFRSQPFPKLVESNARETWFWVWYERMDWWTLGTSEETAQEQIINLIEYLRNLFH